MLTRTFYIKRAHATERAPVRIQRLTLAATPVQFIAPYGDGTPPASGEVRLTGDVVIVTTTSSYTTVKLPPANAVQDVAASHGYRLVCASASPKPLVIQTSAGAGMVAIQPGGSAFFQHNSVDGPVLVEASTPSPVMSPAAGDQELGLHYVMEVLVAAGAGNTDIPGSKFQRAYKILPTVRFLSNGASGGTVQLKTAGGAADVTAAITPGNSGVTAAPASYTLANLPLAAGAGLRVVAAVGNPGGWLYIEFRPQ